MMRIKRYSRYMEHTRLTNTLRYVKLNDVTDEIEDGVVIVAHMADVEAGWPEVRRAEQIAGSTNWRRSWNDGVYHYELLVARQGLTSDVDARGYEITRVNGTGRYF